MREYIENRISIDGRNIPYKIVDTGDYLEAKLGMTEEEMGKFLDEDPTRYDLITQVIALKHSCYLMRRVSHSSGSLAENLYDLKLRLIEELQDNHNFVFDDDFMENY